VGGGRGGQPRERGSPLYQPPRRARGWPLALLAVPVSPAKVKPKPVTVSTCRTCGDYFEQSGKGRPRLDCTECRPPGSPKVRQNSQGSPEFVAGGVVGTGPVEVLVPAGTVIAPAKPTLRSTHPFEPDPRQSAWRWCYRCGRQRAAHEGQT